MNIAKQFAKRVRWIVDQKSSCWNVVNGKDNGNGYIYITFGIPSERSGPRGGAVWKSKRMGAHRAAYLVFNGEIPKGKSIMHSCDNRSCVNPDHLSIGTRKQNTQDMVNKGRVFRREKGSPRNKLSDQQTVDIRNSELSSYQLAKIYPVSSTQIRRIKSGARCSSIN